MIRGKSEMPCNIFLPRHYKPSTIEFTPTINLASIITAKICLESDYRDFNKVGK